VQIFFEQTMKQKNNIRTPQEEPKRKKQKR
jgi:hypothetical protein